MTNSLLDCERIVARGVEPRDLKRLPERITVRKSAFIPRKNGNDNDGLSVTTANGSALERLRNLSPDKEGVTLHVGSVRAMQAGPYRLDVVADPLESDIDHALIIGMPRRHADESAEEKAGYERLAELLAQHARCCL